MPSLKVFVLISNIKTFINSKAYTKVKNTTFNGIGKRINLYFKWSELKSGDKSAILFTIFAITPHIIAVDGTN